jgi:lipoprotein-anchoring transpeptidase ErfK/SrfK
VVLLAALAAGGIAAFLLPGEGSSAYQTQLAARDRRVHPAARPADRGVSVAETPKRGCDRPTVVGTVATRKVVARAAPNPSARPIAKFGRLNVVGAPQVFDILRRVETGTSGVWFKALLPMRPNGTTGYIPANTLRLSETTYRLTISRRLFRLTLWEGCSRLKVFPIGIGTGKTPTPVGRFYLIGLVKPPNPDTIYGSYAYGLSAYSDVITHWRGGGIIGLHGTNDPSSIGRRSSHGCIRMRNRHIESLVKILPLGAPIEIS